MMDGFIIKAVLVIILGLIVFIGYVCLIQGARQDEIDQKDYEEYEKSEKKNWEE